MKLITGILVMLLLLGGMIYTIHTAWAATPTSEFHPFAHGTPLWSETFSGGEMILLSETQHDNGYYIEVTIMTITGEWESHDTAIPGTPSSIMISGCANRLNVMVEVNGEISLATFDVPYRVPCSVYSGFLPILHKEAVK